jgi:hypothetical protein
MQAQVISLAAMPQRRGAIAGDLNALGLDFAFFDAVDGRDGDVSGHVVCRPDSPHRAYTHRERPVSAAELACTLSHMLAIGNAWENGQRGPLLMLEDDALFCAKRAVVEAVIARAPADAAYVQLALTPTATITHLADHARQGGLFTPKSGPITVQMPDGTLGCHCTAAYLITQAGMRAIAQNWLEGDRVILPCEPGELGHNVALVADRLVYQAASSQGARGYVCNLPLVTTRADESTLHPDHVAWHQEARDAALSCYEELAPLLLD